MFFRQMVGLRKQEQCLEIKNLSFEKMVEAYGSVNLRDFQSVVQGRHLHISFIRTCRNNSIGARRHALERLIKSEQVELDNVIINGVDGWAEAQGTKGYGLLKKGVKALKKLLL